MEGAVSAPGWSDLAIGICFGDQHAYNVFITVENKVFILEPQTDKIIDPKEAGKHYKPTHFVLM